MRIKRGDQAARKKTGHPFFVDTYGGGSFHTEMPPLRQPYDRRPRKSAFLRETAIQGAVTDDLERKNTMRSILERLYEGELYPAEKIVSTDPKYPLLEREIHKVQNALHVLLNEDGRKQLEHLGKLYMEENTMDCYAGFRHGFQLGARLMCEIFIQEER